MLFKKIILFILMFLLIGCVSPSKSFYKKKHPTDNRRSYEQKRELMLLDNTQIGKNKYMNSKSYYRKLKRSNKKIQ